MRNMLAHLPACIERVVEGTYMFGDVQTTLCLREAGVRYNVEALEFETLMMNYPPGLIDPDRKKPLEGLALQWPQQHPCARVFAVHHLLPEQLQAVFDAETAAPERRPTYAELWRRLRTPLNGNGTELSHMQLSGVITTGLALDDRDYMNPPGEPCRSATACRDMCAAAPRCVQWSHRGDTAACSLRQAFGRIHIPLKLGQFTSGAMLDRFVCSDREAAAQNEGTATR